ncbi:MAG TPA: maleylpyruvate isomerase N-terminal domain-containing protein [Streptosporangiaceae bacterium]
MDAITEWTKAQQRVCALVQSLGAAETGRPVPACPDWTVTQLLAHMVGLNADVLAGDEPDDHNPAWTRRQVESRAGQDPAGLVAEWRGLTRPVQDWMPMFGGLGPLPDRPLPE